MRATETQNSGGGEGLETANPERHVVLLPASEAARNDLYNGFAELLGPDRAETLMSYLPHNHPDDVARRADSGHLESRIDRLELRIDRVEGQPGVGFAEVHTRLDAGLAAVNSRLDRLFLALVAGLIVVLAAMAGLVATTL